MATDSKASSALDLKTLSNELATISDWYVLGLKLGLRPDQLHEIESSKPTAGVERWKPEMLDKWLRTDSSASWENVVSALQNMGEDAVAKRIIQKHVQAKEAVAGLGPTAVSDDFTKRNLSMIQRKFAKLLLFVHPKFEKELNKKDFLIFLLSVLPAETMKCVPQSSDLEEIFQAITSKKLWTFLNFYLLEQVIEQFWENDEEMVRQMEQYKKDLSGYKTATKLKDHIAAALQLDAETLAQSPGDSDDSETKYDPKYFKLLSVKLDEAVAVYSLDYLDDLWKSLRFHLRLPPLALLLDTIHEGCICVTWLIPTHLVRQCIERARQPVDFFEGFPILRVTIDDVLVYEEKPIESEGKEIHEDASKEKLSGYQITMAARANSRRRRYGAPRKDCVKYKLLGKCDHGDDCKFAHEYRPPRTFTDYIQLPKGLPLGMAIGRRGSNLKHILSAVEFVIQPSERSEGEVEIITADKAALEKTVEKLSALFAQVYPLGPTWCYIHTEGIAEVAGKLLLEFKEYQGKFPTHLFHGQRHNPMYEVCCCKSSTSGATSAHDTSLEELKKLNPTASPLDSMDVLHKALDSMHSGAVSSRSQTVLTVRPTARARIMTEYKEDIRDRLQGALEWGLKNQSPNHMFKLEARFGKLLWFNLPDDIMADDKPWGVEQFAEFVFRDTIRSQCFNTDVKKQNAEHLRAELSDPEPLLETFDIKLSTTFAGQGRHKLDLRLKLKGGKLEVILLKQNETKVVTFDVLNLHREHDVRISLNRLEIVPESHQLYGVAHRLFQSLRIPKPGMLELIPYANDWNVEFIRHKKRTAYVIDDKYMVTITAIQEYRTDWEKLPKGQAVTVDFNGFPEHIEVEFHNNMWACTFGKDIGFTPEKALALHTEHPAVTPQLAASIPHPWGVQDILQDYDEFLDYLDQLNESLGII